MLSLSVNFCRSKGLLELSILEIHSFPQFFPTCFDILSWNFVYDFLFMNLRSSSSVGDLRQLLYELCPVWNWGYSKCKVFRTFLPHALTHWARIWLSFYKLHLSCSSVLVLRQFFIRPSSDGTYYGMLMSVRPGLRPSVHPSVSHSFPHFSPLCFDTLSWNVAYDFFLMYYRSNSSVVTLRHFL